MAGQAWHIVMVFIFIGVFFNLIARPDSWVKFLSGTFGSLVDVSKGLAGIR
jgi:hypothetical protein